MNTRNRIEAAAENLLLLQWALRATKFLTRTRRSPAHVLAHQHVRNLAAIELAADAFADVFAFAELRAEKYGHETTQHFSLAMNYRWHDYRSCRITMLTKQPSLNNGSARSRVEDALAHLSYEDSKLGIHRLDAAVAGAVVARQPSDPLLRAEAAEAWSDIRPVIARHIAREQEIILPWAKMREDFPPVLIMRAHEQHLRLRHLAEAVDATSFITGTDEEVVKGGTALTAFAVCLDNLIDGEERDLFPMIERVLLAETAGS
jgi:Hemerythrin HHE cation binding domain